MNSARTMFTPTMFSRGRIMIIRIMMIILLLLLLLLLLLIIIMITIIATIATIATIPDYNSKLAGLWGLPERPPGSGAASPCYI